MAVSSLGDRPSQTTVGPTLKQLPIDRRRVFKLFLSSIYRWRDYSGHDKKKIGIGTKTRNEDHGYFPKSITKNTLVGPKGGNNEKNHRFVPGAVLPTPITWSVFTFSIQTPLRISTKRKFDYVRTTKHAHAVFYIIIQYYI